MHRKRLPKSIGKFIRREKALIRRRVLDIKEQEKLIAELYTRISPASVAPIKESAGKSKEKS